MKRVTDEKLRHVYERACVNDVDGVASELVDGEEPDGSGDMYAMSIVSELIDARAVIDAYEAGTQPGEPLTCEHVVIVDDARRRYFSRWGKP